MNTSMLAAPGPGPAVPSVALHPARSGGASHNCGVVIQDGLAVVRFGPRFDLDSYRLFLKCKALPESQIEYDRWADAYTITTPARFASLLGAQVPTVVGRRLPLASHLRDYQRWIVDMAVKAKRFAVYADTGLGKMCMALEWARQVMALTGGRVLILVPTLELIEQYHDETARFYGDSLPLTVLHTREDLAAWCKGGGSALAPPGGVAPPLSGGVGVSTYQKFVADTLPELRYLAGLVADEASILKTKGGVIKWNLMKSAQGLEYKLACTATPAPNEPMEYASQAGFLEKINNGVNEIWAYFSRKGDTQDWIIKPHAKAAFYRWMASWSVYMRDPAAFGFEDVLSTLPQPEMIEAALPLSDHQRDLMFDELSRAGVGMLADERMPMPLRIKLAQIASGFTYHHVGGRRRADRFPSAKTDYIVDAVHTDLREKGPVIVWTVFDEQSLILEERLAGAAPPGGVGVLHGGMSDRARHATLSRFRAGDLPVLISKPSLIGYGLNLQMCKGMIFAGFDDSFERRYQAIRRAYRPGQTDPVRVRLPYIRELEAVVFDNVAQKEARFLAEVAIQERHYREALKELNT